MKRGSIESKFFKEKSNNLSFDISFKSGFTDLHTTVKSGNVSLLTYFFYIVHQPETTLL
jgi:hypothetical protein